MSRMEQIAKTSRLAVISLVFGAISLITSFPVRMRIETNLGLDYLIKPPELFFRYYDALGFVNWLWPLCVILSLLLGLFSIMLIERSEGQLKGRAMAFSAIALVAVSIFIGSIYSGISI